MLLWLAILLASLTAIVNAKSLDETRQSLDLTRKSFELVRQSTRAFLSVYDVRYEPTSVSGPLLSLGIRNTGILPAHNIVVEHELFSGDGNHGPHLRIEQPTLKPGEDRKVMFTLPPYVLDMILTEKSYLFLGTEFSPDIAKTSFYHTDRHYSIPPHIKTLDHGFAFVLSSGGAFD